MFRSFALAAPFAAAALVLTAGGAQAQAEDFQSNGRTTEVYHGDLDLSDPADQKLLRSRIGRAALRVCRTNDAAALRDCRAKAIAHVEAPGPIWTPLNPCGGASEEKLEHFGESTPMGRPGQPNEVAPAFLFLACQDASYMTGQVLHPNGGMIVNG